MRIADVRIPKTRDPFDDIETISPRPMLFITGTEAHSCEFGEDAYTRAAEPKELHWVPGAGTSICTTA